MQARSILNGSSFSPFIFHSTCIFHGAKSFWMCGQNYGRSVDTAESKSTCEDILGVLFQVRSCQQQNMEFGQLLWSSSTLHNMFFKVLFHCIFLRHHQSCGSSWLGHCKGKEVFLFSASSFFYNPHGAVVVGRKPHFVPGRVFEPSHICINCFHLRHFLQFMSPDVGALFSILYLPNPATGLQLINLVSFI